MSIAIQKYFIDANGNLKYIRVNVILYYIFYYFYHLFKILFEIEMTKFKIGIFEAIFEIVDYYPWLILNFHLLAYPIIYQLS